tara:strand:+ start:277 stop:1197 length:921 start_codon:yes stop_codon:yes gene_type:complete
VKKLIAVLMGGSSREREISFLTGRACSSALKRKGYKVINIDTKNEFVEKIKKIKPKIIFNALHGKYGEDGYVQSILEYLKIPYTHSGIASSSLAMNKELSKIFFKKNKLLIPKSIVIKKNQNISNVINYVKKKIKFPLVIKPINEGSSLGVFICNNSKMLKNNFKKLSKLYNRILLEQYIPGREIQVAVMGNKPLGAIELIPKRKFYDYKAKYSTNAKTKHIMPAVLSKKKYTQVLKIAKKAHKSLGCRGITRSDFRFNNNKFYLLETNTQPGMTKLSLVPEIAKYKGITFENLVDWIVKDASYNR